jgi:hypothetical protein
MFQPGTYKDGVLGSAAQPGAYHDGTLGILSQPGAYRDGTLGALAQPGAYNDGTLGLVRTGTASLSPDLQRRAAAMRAAQRSAQYAAAQAARRASMRGLGFAMQDVPTWGWIAGGVAVVAASVYLLKK